ncbi:Oidioi.mRNA.OKI2018_I69.chr1.g3782.t1.cds [Oikopleura dioica]|uniref:Oidioi.mRNA.OKI2018_I69.chr1.g3782.t1.cds n=1 Tax=Oikopleura dioica TaxID=34765 RepID=A0ABN7T0R7_OIKDI|nr:Oidioi.mRNA.OKI2018_I69.chr1.g3782.t1.cds [Oikopleura dioica]
MESLHLIQLVNGAFSETYRVEHLNLDSSSSSSSNQQLSNQPKNLDQLKLIAGGYSSSYRERICGAEPLQEQPRGDLHQLISGGLSETYRVNTLGQPDSLPEAKAEDLEKLDTRHLALIHGGLSDEYRKKACGHPPKREFKRNEAKSSIFAPFRARLGI